jgi:sialate O-acetylesterase
VGVARQFCISIEGVPSVRNKLWVKVSLAVLVLGVLAAVAAADVKLPAVFSDHMVLQRDMPIKVWGWADPGEKVTVNFASPTGSTVPEFNVESDAGLKGTISDLSLSATADARGAWSVRFPAMKAGGPLVLKVQGNNELIRSDVLVGEVWVGSGQSNMQMTVGSSADAAAEIAAAEYPRIRLFTVDRKTAQTPQKNCQGAWALCSPKTVGGFSAAAYFFGRSLHQELKVPVGLIDSSWGGTPIEAWTSLRVQQGVPELAGTIAWFKKVMADWNPEKAQQQYQAQLAEWGKAVEKAKAEHKPEPGRPWPPQDPHTSPNSPGRLYNGMIVPLAFFAIRGAIWYQGESNAGNAKLYGLQLRTMIANWRKLWGEPGMEFLFVQLPNFLPPQKNPSETGGWPLIREQFFQTLAVPHTGMAVTIDIGDAADIHPKNKQDVGKRLAQWALAKVYGRHVVACGPLYKSMRKQGDAIELKFDYAGGGLEAKGGGALRGFAIAGADKKFVWASAVIDEGKKVIVSSPEVKDPQAVRYGWANNPDCNLVNRVGLPASPFRTDNWSE